MYTPFENSTTGIAIYSKFHFLIYLYDLLLYLFAALVEFACINFLDTFVKRKKQEVQKNQEKAEKDVKKVETVVNSIETNNVHEILKEKPVDNHDVAAIIKWNAIKGGKISEYFHFCPIIE